MALDPQTKACANCRYFVDNSATLGGGTLLPGRCIRIIDWEEVYPYDVCKKFVFSATSAVKTSLKGVSKND